VSDLLGAEACLERPQQHDPVALGIAVRGDGGERLTLLGIGDNLGLASERHKSSHPVGYHGSSIKQHGLPRC
jgi:hypothetical protein